MYLKRSKWREIIAKFLIVIVLLTMPGMQTIVVYAEDGQEKLSGSDVKAVPRGGSFPDCYLGDLHLFNISLAEDEPQQGGYKLECGITNTGSENFNGALRFCFYDENGFLIKVSESYFSGVLLPGETVMTKCHSYENILGAAALTVQKKSSINNNVNTTATFDNMIEMYDIILYPINNLDEPEYWGIRFGLRALQTIPDAFLLNIFFKNEMGEIKYQTSSQIEGKNLGETYNFAIPMYGSADLSDVCSIEISADFPAYTPSPSPTATATATAEPTPTRSAENTSVPQPTQDAPVTAEPISTPDTPGETEPSRTPGIFPTEEPVKTQMPEETVSPIPSPTLPVTAKPSGAPVPTAQPQTPAPTPIRLTETTALPTASPAVKPTQAPVVSKPGRTKLVRPVIRIKIRKLYKNMWMAQIRIIKYQGTDIQIYYRRGKGKYKKIKLKRTNIKKNKKIFKVGYKKGKKNIYLRVRTYQKKGGKKWYSLYSKIRRLS